MSFAQEMKDFFSGFKQTQSIVGDIQDRRQAKQDREDKKKDTFDVEGARKEYPGAGGNDGPPPKNLLEDVLGKGKPTAAIPEAASSGASDSAPDSASSRKPPRMDAGPEQVGYAPVDTPTVQRKQVAQTPDDGYDYLGPYGRGAIDTTQEANPMMYSAGGGAIPDNQDMNQQGNWVGAPHQIAQQPTAAIGQAPQGQVQPQTPPTHDSAGLGEALHSGLTFLQKSLGLDKKTVGVGEDTTQNSGHQKLLEGYVTPNEPPPKPQEIQAVHQTVDPQGKMDDALRNVYALQKGYEFYRDRGEMDKASKFAASLIQASGDDARQFGIQAMQAGKQGDVPGMVSNAVKAYNAIPDGHNATAQAGPNGSVQVTRTDADGKVIDQHQLTPQQIMQMATGISSKSGYYEALMQAASPPDSKTALDQAKLAETTRHNKAMEGMQGGDKAGAAAEKLRHNKALEDLASGRLGVEQGHLDETKKNDQEKAVLQMPTGKKEYVSAIKEASSYAAQVTSGGNADADPTEEAKKKEFGPTRDLIGALSYFGGNGADVAAQDAAGLIKGDPSYSMDKDDNGNLRITRDGAEVATLPWAMQGRIKSLQKTGSAAGKTDATPAATPAPAASAQTTKAPAAPLSTEVQAWAKKQLARGVQQSDIDAYLKANPGIK